MIKNDILLITIAIILTILLLCSISTTSNFQNRYTYDKTTLVYENDPTVSNFNYPLYKEDKIIIPNINKYKNRELYAIP